MIVYVLIKEDASMFKNIKFKTSKTFEKLGLNNLWDKFEMDEKEFIYNSYLSVGMDILNHYFLDSSQLHFIWNMIMWFQSKRKDETTQKIISYVNTYNIYEKSNDIEDKHFYLIQVIQYYYHPRSPEIHNSLLAKKYAYEDIELFTKNVNIFKSAGTIARDPSFKILALILEKEKNYKEAIRICELALKYEQDDGTKSGVEGRMEKLNKKL